MDFSHRRTHFSHEFAKMVADAVGCTNISDEAIAELSEVTTAAVKDLLQVAKSFMERCKRKRLLCSDFDAALRHRNYEPLYGYSSPEPIPFRYASGGGREVYFLDDKDVDLDDVIKNAPVELPRPVTLAFHWLAIDGVQLAIPQNPAQVARQDESKSKAHGSGTKLEKTKYNSKELANVRSQITHDLSSEQQLYFKEITEGCVGSDELKRTEILESLSTDTGLQPLLPRFSAFITEGVRSNIVQHNLALLIYFMRMVKALLDNAAVDLERFLHEIVPSVTSCVIGSQLCARPEIDNHWALREFAGRLLIQMCRMYSTSVSSIQSRLTSQLAEAWKSKESSYATLYGAAYAVCEMGCEPIKAVIMPALPDYSDGLKVALENETEKTGAEHLRQILVKVLAQYAKTVYPKMWDVGQFRDVFGFFLGTMVHAAVSAQTEVNFTPGSLFYTPKQCLFGSQQQTSSSGNRSSFQKNFFSSGACPQTSASSQKVLSVRGGFNEDVASSADHQSLTVGAQVKLSDSPPPERAESSCGLSSDSPLVKKIKLEPPSDSL